VERSVVLPVLVSLLLLRWQARQPVCLIRAGLQVEEPDDISRHHLVGFVGGDAVKFLSTTCGECGYLIPGAGSRSPRSACRRPSKSRRRTPTLSC